MTAEKLAAHKTYEQAAGPKKLEMFEGGDHVCMNFFSEVRNLVADWLAENLA